MKINFNECNAILSTLPVGYYCGRRIPISLDAEAETSYYVPMEDTICISFPIIEKGVHALPDNADLEKSVRSMLYHETSHAILTPKRLMSSWDNEEVRNVMNVFEDERIETLLANFYMNVDFKAQLYNICGEPETPKDAFNAFYNIVRYRVGPGDLVVEVAKIISRYNSITSKDTYIANYRRDIWELYDKVKKLFGKTPSVFSLPMDIKVTSGEGESTGASKATNATSAQAEKADATSETKPIYGSLNTEQISKIMSEVFKPTGKLRADQREQIEQFERTLQILFANFNKKNSGGNGINTYSGVFNPRATVRKDYRYFERSINANGNNKFGSLHLNLFLDRSGSFCNNEDVTNAILTVLSDFERRNKNFTLDVFFINEEMVKANTVRERVMSCNGGNNIPDYVSEMFIKAQKPNTFNYNIVLFDGDALSDCYGEHRQDRAKRFKTFDRKQTFLITDEDNERYLKLKPYTTAKVIVTNNYNTELIKNITRAFKTMLA